MIDWPYALSFCAALFGFFAMLRARLAEARIGILEDQIDLLSARLDLCERVDAAVVPAIRGVCDGIAARAAKGALACTGPLGACTMAGGRCVHCGRTAKEARPS